MNLNSPIRRNEKGQTIVEYIVVTALIGIFCLVAVKNFGTTLRDHMEQMRSKVARRIVVGS